MRSQLTRLAGRSQRLHTAAMRAARTLRGSRSGASGERLAIITIPKAGTHLLTVMLEGTGGALPSYRHLNRGTSRIVRGGDVPAADVRLLRALRPGQFMTMHHEHEPSIVEILSELDIRTVFVYRDPRAVALSHAHYIRGLRRHRLHARWNELSLEDAVRASMRGDEAPAEGVRGLPSLASRYDAYEGWLSAAELPVSFESLVGPAETRGQVLHQIAQLLRLEPQARQAFVVGAEDWIGHRASPTLRSGRAGSWREELAPHVLADLETDFGPDRLRRWGYDGD